jgi:hypothetical protein
MAKKLKKIFLLVVFVALFPVAGNCAIKKTQEEVLYFNEKSNNVIEYVKKSNRIVPNDDLFIDKIRFKEKISARLPNSQLYQNENKLIRVIYNAGIMILYNDQWYYTDYATSSKKDFAEISKQNNFLNIFVKPAIASNDIIYSNTDGFIQYGSATWSTVHDSASGNATNNSIIGQEASKEVDNIYYIQRGYLKFDTSILGSEAIISSSTFSCFGYGSKTGNNAQNNVSIYRSAEYTSIQNSDFGKATTEKISDTTLTYSTFNATGWNDFLLNSAGLSNINKTGTTYIAYRNVTQDANNVAPTYFNPYGFLPCYSSTGTYKPKLTIVFTTSTPPTMENIIYHIATSSIPLATSGGSRGINEYVQYLAAILFGSAILILVKMFFITSLRAVKGLFIPPRQNL